jgi:transposase InsO family protein
VSALQANTAQNYNDLKAVYWQHHARLGAPSLVHDMHDLGYNMSERTIGRMLKKLGLRSRIARKYKHTTDSNHLFPTAPNLLDRQFKVTQPNPAKQCFSGQQTLPISALKKVGCTYV